VGCERTRKNLAQNNGNKRENKFNELDNNGKEIWNGTGKRKEKGPAWRDVTKKLCSSSNINYSELPRKSRCGKDNREVQQLGGNLECVLEICLICRIVSRDRFFPPTGSFALPG
jgi:hypothetical protein